MTTKAIMRQMNHALAQHQTDVFLSLLYDECRAVGMSEIARRTGLQREALYKPFRQGAQPRFDTVNRILAALNVRIVVAPIRSKR